MSNSSSSAAVEVYNQGNHHHHHHHHHQVRSSHEPMSMAESYSSSSSAESFKSESDFSKKIHYNNNNSSCESSNVPYNETSSKPIMMFISSEEDDSSSPASSLPTSTSAPAAKLSDAAKKKRKKKKLAERMSTTNFKDIYYLTGDVLGEGSYGRVETCINMYTDVEYAVKMISKKNWCFSRSKVLKEVELYYLCQGQKEIIQLIEYFEEEDFFYLIFEKAYGGPLLNQIQNRVHFTEEEAVSIVRDLAIALRFLHEKGIAHRDLKPENILCVNANAPYPIKLCDFDLCSSVNQSLSTPLLQSPVGSAEYMAPEVVNAFDYDDFSEEEDEFTYDKRCDLWSLGIITYILLCGYLPFSGHCDNECGWEQGEECLQCQRSLFEAIRSGTLVFPDAHWASISEEAKDLISHLLVKDASQRLDANSVLNHPWIVQGGSSAKSLDTPSVLRRQISVKEMSEFATNALAIKRNFDTKFSFSRAFNKLLNTSDSCASTTEQTTPMRKTSAQVFRKTSGHLLMMRRQTSMILLEDAALRSNASSNRCEY